MTEGREKKYSAKRIQFDLTEVDMRDFTRLTTTCATTGSEVIRRALRVFSWVVNDVDKDDVIQIVDRAGNVKQTFPAKLFRQTF